MIATKKIFIWTLSISSALFIIGLTTFTQLLALLEPAIEGIQFIIKGNWTAFLFSLMLALIPLLTVTTWQISHITLLNKRGGSLLIIISTIAFALFARHQEVKIFFTRVVRPKLLTGGTTHIQYPIDPRNFVYYLFYGLLAGCILTFLLLRQKKPGSIIRGK